MRGQAPEGKSQREKNQQAHIWALTEGSLRTCLVLGQDSTWEELSVTVDPEGNQVLCQVAFCNWLPQTPIAAITAHVVSWEDALLGWYPGTSSRSLIYPRRNAWSPAKLSKNRCPVAPVFRPRQPRRVLGSRLPFA